MVPTDMVLLHLTDNHNNVEGDVVHAGRRCDNPEDLNPFTTPTPPSSPEEWVIEHKRELVELAF